MKAEIGYKEKVIVEIDPQDAEFVMSKKWRVTPPIFSPSYQIQEWGYDETGRPLRRNLSSQIYERRAGISLGKSRIFYRNGNELDLRFENIEIRKSPKKIMRGEQELPEGVALLESVSERCEPKFQGVIEVAGVKRYVGKPTGSVKRALQARDAYIREHNLSLPLLVPPELKKTPKWTYEPQNVLA